MKKEISRTLTVEPRRRTLAGGWHPATDKEANEWAVIDQNRQWVAEFATPELAAEYIRLTKGLPPMPGPIAIQMPVEIADTFRMKETIAHISYECGSRTMNPLLQEKNELYGVVGVMMELIKWSIEFEEKYTSKILEGDYLEAIQKFINEKLETPVSRGTKQGGVHSGNVNA